MAGHEGGLGTPVKGTAPNPAFCSMVDAGGGNLLWKFRGSSLQPPGGCGAAASREGLSRDTGLRGLWLRQGLSDPPVFRAATLLPKTNVTRKHKAGRSQEATANRPAGQRGLIWCLEGVPCGTGRVTARLWAKVSKCLARAHMPLISDPRVVPVPTCCQCPSGSGDPRGHPCPRAVGDPGAAPASRCCQ